VEGSGVEWSGWVGGWVDGSKGPHIFCGRMLASSCPTCMGTSGGAAGGNGGRVERCARAPAVLEETVRLDVSSKGGPMAVVWCCIVRQ